MLFLPGLAKADSVWSFVGEMTDPGTWRLGITSPCQCNLDGTVLFDDNFEVLAYSFTDGTHTLNQNDSTIVFQYNPVSGVSAFPFTVANQKNLPPLSSWQVGITGADVSFQAIYEGPDMGAININASYLDNKIFGWGQPNSGPNGAWTEIGTVNTPESGSMLLLGAGLTALVLAIALQKTLA
jgi:hypothetical protein